MSDPRVVVGPSLLDRIARLESSLREIQSSLIGSSILGTDQTIKASHDRLDSLLGEDTSAPDGTLVTNFNADLLDGLHASEVGGSAIWLGAATATRTQGTGSTGTSGPGSSKSPYVTMPDGSDTAYAWSFWVPTEWDEATVEVWFVAEVTSTSGNVYLQVCYSYASNGSSSGETTFGESFAAWSNYKIAQMTDTLSLSAEGTLFRIAFRRLSSDPSDDCTGTVNLHGIALVRTS